MSLRMAGLKIFVLHKDVGRPSLSACPTKFSGSRGRGGMPSPSTHHHCHCSWHRRHCLRQHHHCHHRRHRHCLRQHLHHCHPPRKPSPIKYSPYDISITTIIRPHHDFRYCRRIITCGRSLVNKKEKKNSKKRLILSVIK